MTQDKNFLSLSFFVSMEELKNLCLLREGDELLDDDELQEICDSVEMFDNDISLAVATYGGSHYEICTTHGRHNLYLIEGEFDEEDCNTTIGVCNISDEIDELRTYEALLNRLQYLNYKKRQGDTNNE